MVMMTQLFQDFDRDKYWHKTDKFNKQIAQVMRNIPDQNLFIPISIIQKYPTWIDRLESNIAQYSNLIKKLPTGWVIQVAKTENAMLALANIPFHPEQRVNSVVPFVPPRDVICSYCNMKANRECRFKFCKNCCTITRYQWNQRHEHIDCIGHKNDPNEEYEQYCTKFSSLSRGAIMHKQNKKQQKKYRVSIFLIILNI
jgi:hypothetical protein